MLRAEEHGARTLAATLLSVAAISSFAVLIPCPLVAQAQTPATPPAAASPAPVEEPAQGTPHFKANVDEVVLDLAVRERGHEGVPKLSAQDLIVTDEGTPVKLRDLHLVNVLTDPAKKPLVTIIFDPFHGPIAKSTRALALKMLNLLPEKGLRMAVMDFDGRLRLVQGFTEDRAPILKAVQLETDSNPTVLNSTLSLELNITSDDKAEAAKKTAADQAEKELISIAQTGSDTANKPVAFEDRLRAQALLQAMENADTIAQKQHVFYTVAGLMALVNAEQSLRERRIIIYFTANRHMTPLSDRTLRSVADSAAAAGISVYTIDMDATGRAQGSDLFNAALNGNALTGKQDESPALGIDPVSVRSQQGYAGHNWTSRDDVAMVTDFARGSGEDRGDPFEDLHNPLQGVSKESGGAYIDALNGTNGALRNLARDLTSYYEATFVPATKNYDGSYRKIAIKATRGDLNIRGRKGYFALPPGVDPGLKPFELPMLKALEQNSLPRQFAFRAAVLRFGDLPNGDTNTLAVEVPLAGLQLQSANASDARVSILAQVRDNSGVVVDHFAQQLVMHDARAELGRDPEAAFALDHHFISAPGHYEIELVARDENSGKISAQRREFDVASQPGSLAISDMVLVRGLEPVSEVNLDPLEPLLFSRNKVTPELDHDLVNFKKAPAVFFLLHPDPSAKDGLDLEMQLVRNGKAGKRTAMVDLFGMQSAVPYMATIGSRPLPAGEYEIRAFLTEGGRTVEQSQHFVISGNQAVAADEEMPVLAAFTNDDTQIAVDENNNIVPAQAPPPMQLPITPVSASATPPPVDESHLLIERSRRNALNYESDVLPHFVCTEVTQRSVDRTGSGKWRLQDTVTERVEYREHTEAHSLLQVNGRSAGTSQGMKGTYSTGEFGGVLRAVFRPAAKAAFTWKGSATLSGNEVEVYDYSVARANSDFSVTGENGGQAVVGFHGTVFIDKATGRVRRITLLADSLPDSFRTRASSISVDYDYVPINGLRYLLPISAQLQAQQGDHEAVLNTMQFSDYRRAGNL